MQKAYDDMRSIASDISYTVTNLENYEDGRDYKIPNYRDDKRIQTVELYDKIFGDYKKVMDFKKYKYRYKFDFYPNKNKKDVLINVCLAFGTAEKHSLGTVRKDSL